MSFSQELKRFASKVAARNVRIFLTTVTEAHSSIVNGSSTTGAPGQPVDTGYLKGSWQTTFESPTEATIATNVVYAPQIEDGTRDGRALTLRSRVGGFHSVKLTIAGLHRIIKTVTVQEVGRG